MSIVEDYARALRMRRIRREIDAAAHKARRRAWQAAVLLRVAGEAEASTVHTPRVRVVSREKFFNQRS
jgi:hypothetical protein